jgi:iron complex outermembrane receptor protein
MKTRKLALLYCATISSGLAAMGPAAAQTAAPAAAPSPVIGEVIVTARKRQESILNVPVVETAVGPKQLERTQTLDLKDLQKLVPGLNLGHGLLSIGTLVSIRGIGTASLDPGIDQSVALNLDGMALGQGLAFSSGMFDVGQVEVLKGPQALFYGKSSPGGVISIRTADPTDKYDVIARAGYEFEARQKRGELIVSGPLTDTLKGRLAGMYSQTDGYFYNRGIPLAGSGATAPDHDRAPYGKDYMVRGTLLWSPTDSFDARLKVNYVHDRADNAEAWQQSSCPEGTAGPLGIPFLGGGEDCKLDRVLRVVSMDPANFPNIINHGQPFLESTQKYGTLELNYKLRPQLTLTSTTGYYDLGSSSLVSTAQSTFAGAALAIENRFKRRDITEEVRLNSDFSSPLNFTAGAFYQDGRMSDWVIGRGNSAYALPPLLLSAETDVNIKTYSAFGQLRWAITPKLELAGGARWTDEKRSEEPVNYITGTATPINVLTPKIGSKTTAPEVTLTYRPTDDLTFFGALKRGYKSGSFSIATPPTNGADNSFGDEKVEGGEVGLKSRLLDRRMNVNLAAYDYHYTGLQVGAVEPAVNGLPIIRTVNAGSARTYGIDFDLTYYPPQLDGLTLRAAVNWNHARFDTLNNVPCYGGQTIALGCTQFLDPSTGRYTAQDLSGSPLQRAPDWQSTFGFDYEIPVGPGGDMTLVITNSNQYSSSYRTFLGDRPDNTQGQFLKMDLGLTLQGPDDRWEVALIGKNITDRITAGTCSPSTAANGVILGGAEAGGVRSGIAGLDEVGCFTDPGREIWLKFTYRPTGR